MAFGLIIPLILIGWLVFAHDHAPEGYQDARGFHFGSKPRLARQVIRSGRRSTTAQDW